MDDLDLRRAPDRRGFEIVAPVAGPGRTFGQFMKADAAENDRVVDADIALCPGTNAPDFHGGDALVIVDQFDDGLGIVQSGFSSGRQVRRGENLDGQFVLRAGDQRVEAAAGRE